MLCLFDEGETTASEWLAQPDVVKALHVNADGGGMTYKKGPMELSGDLRPLYAKCVVRCSQDFTLGIITAALLPVCYLLLIVGYHCMASFAGSFQSTEC